MKKKGWIKKTRRNIYFRNHNYEKLCDIQYLFRKNSKKKLTISAIINVLIDKTSEKQLIKLLREVTRDSVK